MLASSIVRISRLVAEKGVRRYLAYWGIAAWGIFMPEYAQPVKLICMVFTCLPS